MKYALLLIVVAAAAYVFFNVFKKRDRRRAFRSMYSWLLPVGIGLLVVIALISFNLNFNGKII